MISVFLPLIFLCVSLSLVPLPHLSSFQRTMANPSAETGAVAAVTAPTVPRVDPPAVTDSQVRGERGGWENEEGERTKEWLRRTEREG